MLQAEETAPLPHKQGSGGGEGQHLERGTMGPGIAMYPQHTLHLCRWRFLGGFGEAVMR